MPGKLHMHREAGTLTASAGAASANILAGNNIMMQIFVKATTATTTFDVTLTDIYSNVTFTREDATGELNELVSLPAYGNWTLSLANASVDEDFTYLIVLREA